MARIKRDMDSELLNLAEDLRQAIGSIVRFVRAEGETPSSAQSETLGLLDRLGPLTVAALAEHRKVKHQSMRLVVAQLEGEGFICRTADPDDRRAQRITLTKTGCIVLLASRRARAAVIATLLRTLPPGDREALSTSIAILHRLTAKPD